MSARADRMPNPGAIVYFDHPADDGRRFLQRCLAIGGQTVSIDNGVVYVDGKPFDEPPGVQRTFVDFGPVVVPDGHFFVMGDNRDRASDSRRWGPVPVEYLRGRVVEELSWTETFVGMVPFLRWIPALDSARH